jgi:hypothetical protein
LLPELALPLASGFGLFRAHASAAALILCHLFGFSTALTF